MARGKRIDPDILKASIKSGEGDRSKRSEISDKLFYVVGPVSYHVLVFLVHIFMSESVYTVNPRRVV